MGSDGFRIVRMAWFGPWDPKKFFEMQKRNPEIRPDEYEFVKEKATLLKDLGMMVSRNARVSYKGDSMEDVNIQGVTDNIPAINNVQVDAGRDITYEEVRRHAPVAFIGNDIRDALFRRRGPGRQDPSRSKATRTRWWACAKALGSVFGNSQDNFVMIPIESYFKTYGSAQRNPPDRQGHRPGAPDGGAGRSRACCCARTGTCGRARTTTFQHFRLGHHREPVGTAHRDHRRHGGGHRLVFMVVGGIVIMNIMLAVVTERTHEIGIRKSLGARRRDILNQYLVESSVLSGAGGLVGVMHGVVRRGAGAQRSLRCRWRCRGPRSSSAWGFRRRWACSSASTPRAAPPSSTPSRPCGRSANPMTRLAFYQRHCAGASDHPQPQTAGLPHGAGRDHRDRHDHRRGGHPHRLRRLHYVGAAQFRTEFDHRVQIPRRPADWPPQPRGAHAQESHLPERRGYPRALQVGRGCLHHAVPQQQYGQRPLQGQRHVRRQPVWRRGSLRARRAGGDAPRALLYGRREPAPPARGGDRRRTWKKACTPTSTRSANRSTWKATSSWSSAPWCARRPRSSATPIRACCCPTARCRRCIPTRARTPSW